MRVGVQLREDGGHVVTDGLGGDEQPGCDLGVAVPGTDQAEDLTLAAGQPERPAACGRGLTTGEI